MGSGSRHPTKPAGGRDSRAGWEVRFRCLAEAAGAIVWYAPPSGRDDEGVSAWAEFTGQSPSEVADEGWAAAIHPEERDEVAAQWYRAAGSRQPFEATYRVRRHDGVYRSMHLRVVPVLDEAGAIVEWVGIATDETEHLAEEAVCRQASQLLATAIESAPMVFFTLDSEGRFTLFDGQVARDRAADGSLVVGTSFLQFPGAPGMEQAVCRALGGETCTWEGEVEGSQFVARLSPLCDADGRIEGVVGVAVDCTELHQAHKALEDREARLAGMLEGVVAALVHAVDLHETLCVGHYHRASVLAVAIARELGWPEEHIETVRLAALLHDVGSLTVPFEVLNDPGPLGRNETALMMEHAAAGAAILSELECLAPVATAVRQHHERLDGSGYPDGLVGGAVEPSARILAVACELDAMVSSHPARTTLTLGDALEELKAGSGTLYDTDVVDACVKLFDSGAFSFEDEPAPG